ncbi:hypothetical protein EVAR_101845_1 [Eumeta japonica]|uniref:Uncharacterized protein n=1 Tax=Eumeta variegata TaxID=151549 RepID=A0A4C1SQN2_EUMVA|nr:hypothetical protein EVAR_101845_1 [Eumeta japonica]
MAAEKVEERSFPTPASPTTIRRPANVPTYARLSRIQTRSSDNDDGATSDTKGAVNATDSSHAAPDDAADPPTTLRNAIGGPTNPSNLHVPPIQVTRGSQQLVPLTWMQARVMEALRAILTGQNPITLLLQVLILDPAAQEK